MSAIEPLVQRVPEPEQVGTVHRLPTADGHVTTVRPPRLNLAGYCLYCFGWQCSKKRCVDYHHRSVWVVCRLCDGSGYDRTAERVCSCESGLADLTNSEWTTATEVRPPRLTFAGWCLWCFGRACDSQICITRHHAATWEVCRHCDGVAVDEATGEPCTCAFGLQVVE